MGKRDLKAAEHRSADTAPMVGWHDGHQVNFGRVGAVVHQRCNADIEAINRGDQGAMSVGGCHVAIDSARDAEPGR